MLLLQKGMKPFFESLPAFSGAPWLSAQTDDSFGRVYVSGPGNCGCRTKSFAIDISSVVPRVPAAVGGSQCTPGGMAGGMKKRPPGGRARERREGSVEFGFEAGPADGVG